MTVHVLPPKPQVSMFCETRYKNSGSDMLLYFPVGYTKAYPQLVPKAPAVSLISLTPIMSIISQMVVIIAFQFFTWEFIKQQPW